MSHALLKIHRVRCTAPASDCDSTVSILPRINASILPRIPVKLRRKCIMLQGFVHFLASTKLDIRQPKERVLCKGRAPLRRGWQRRREYHIGPDIEHRLRGYAPLGTTVCAIVGDYGHREQHLQGYGLPDHCQDCCAVGSYALTLLSIYIQ